MPPSARPPRSRWLACVLLALFVAQALAASLIKSATFDEPAHIAAGLSYFHTGEFKINQQHPPLLKEIGALPLLALGVPWPVSRDQWAQIPDPPPPFVQWNLGHRILTAGGPARVLFWSRLPFIVIGALLGWILWDWGRRLVGPAAAALGLALYVFDPTLIAHTALVTMDVGFAAAAVLFAYALWTWINDRTLKRLLRCGAALGLALATKFSALFLIPAAALLMLGAVAWVPAAVPRRRPTAVDPYAAGDATQRLIWGAWAGVAILAVAAAVVYALYFLPSNPFLYLRGLRLVNADHDPTYWPYMAGSFAPRFLTYYVLAWLLKEPVGALILVGAGVVALLRREGATRLDRAFLLVPPAILFAAHALFAHGLGFRYVIPALPFLHLTGGVGGAWLWRAGKTFGRTMVVIACVWLVVAAAGIYPDHLSYFNELACALADPARIGIDGGSRCGPMWFDDSNVDWGQGVRQLKRWTESHPGPAPLYLAYFGSMAPEDEGVIAQRIGLDGLLRPPEPGRYAVSTHFMARAGGLLRGQGLRGPAAWLLEARPVAVVGHAYAIFDFPPAVAPPGPVPGGR